jgi:hypothetical protein
VRAHQDNKMGYQYLSQPSQLNCTMDFNAKIVLLDIQPMIFPSQHAFSLEPVCAFTGPTKITADTGQHLWYWAHRRLAKKLFYQMDIMYSQQFELVDWEMVYLQLNSIPKLFQLWACKQVMGIAGTIEWDKTVIRKCPSCMQEWDTCAHVLHCCHTGRVETLHHTINIMEAWMKEVDTDPDLLDCIAEYAYAQGNRAMTKFFNRLGEIYLQMACNQDAIGWQRFMESMIATQMREIQCQYHISEGTQTNPEQWAQGLILKLLEATHGQWLYWNVKIYDPVSGTHVTIRKEAIQKEIKEQMELGEAGLLEEDNWMLEVNPGDLESTSGEQEQHWLVAIKATWEAAMITRQNEQAPCTQPQKRRRALS